MHYSERQTHDGRRECLGRTRKREIRAEHATRKDPISKMMHDGNAPCQVRIENILVDKPADLQFLLCTNSLRIKPAIRANAIVSNVLKNSK